MADNVSMVDDLLEVDIPAPSRSWFDRSYTTRFTCSPGYGNVVGLWEILPNSTVDLDADILLKSSATTNSVYGTLRQSIQAFFIPSRIYCRELDQNNLNGIAPRDITQFPVIQQGGYRIHPDDELYVPVIAPYESTSLSVSDSWCVTPGSLLEMIGYFPVNFPISNLSESGLDAFEFSQESVAPPLNAIPWLGYWDIFRNYYFNRQEPLFGIVEYESNTDTSMNSFYGTQLDEMFDKVMSKTEDYLINTYVDGGPYNILSVTVARLLFNMAISPIPYNRSVEDEQVYHHGGLWRRCYDDDYFVSRLSNEYVSELDTTSRVTVSGNGFSISQFRLAHRNDNYSTKNIYGGTRYDDWLDVHYGAKLNRKLNIPEFLGSASAQFYFDDIYATAQAAASDTFDASPSSVGDRAATLNAAMRVNQFAKFTAEEHGYLMVIYSIVPRVDYYGGTPKMFFKTSLADVYKPEYDAIGFQEMIKGELSGPTLDSYDVVANQPAWMEYMVDYNKLHGDFASPTSDEYVGRNMWTISRNTADSSGFDNGLTTYIEGWKFNSIFTETANWKDNFDCQIHFTCRVAQPMSKQILPRL